MTGGVKIATNGTVENIVSEPLIAQATTTTSGAPTTQCNSERPASASNRAGNGTEDASHTARTHERCARDNVTLPNASATTPTEAPDVATARTNRRQQTGDENRRQQTGDEKHKSGRNRPRLSIRRRKAARNRHFGSNRRQLSRLK